MRLRPLLRLVAVALLAWSLTASAAAPPRLVVVIVADQFRADYLTTFASHWRAGVQTLLRDGANFRRAQYPYAYTDTCAGHSTIATGTLPRTHGMIADSWWDHETNLLVDCTDDEAASIISYGSPLVVAAPVAGRGATPAGGRGAAPVGGAGNSPRNLLAQTLADELRQQRPGGRVVTLSLKERAAINLAGHSGDAVMWFDEAAGTFATSSAFASAPVPEVTQFIDASPYVKDVGFVWTLRDPSTTYRNRDAGVGERPSNPWSGLFPHNLEGATAAQYANLWRRTPAADVYLARMATALIDAYRLGQAENKTDFLGISFSTLDYVGHQFGPDSREVEDIAAHLDDVLGSLIAHLDDKVGRAKYVLAFTADHGVAPVPSPAKGFGRLTLDDVRERIEETLRNRYGPPDKDAHVARIYYPNVYLSPAIRQRLAADPLTVRAVQDAVTSLPGVARLLYTPELSDRSRDPLVRAAALGRAATRSGAFLIVQKRNWVLGPRGTADATTHGSPYDYDQHVPLILLGGGIRRGTYDAAAAPTDIAPTLAALAGVTLAKVEGRVLQEALLPDSQTTRR